MKSFRISALPFAIAVLVFGIASAARADGHHHRCTLQSVAGTFGYSTTGTRNGIGPVAGVGTLVFDGEGNVLDGMQTVSFGGIIATETYSGTYTVGDNCRGSFTVTVTSSVPAFNRTSTLDVVWEDDTNRAQAIFTGDGTVITAEAHRVFSHD